MGFVFKFFLLICLPVSLVASGGNVSPQGASQAPTTQLFASGEGVSATFVSQYTREQGLEVFGLHNSFWADKTPLLDESIGAFVNHVGCPKVKECVAQSIPSLAPLLEDYFTQVAKSVQRTCDPQNTTCVYPQLMLTNERGLSTSFGFFSAAFNQMGVPLEVTGNVGGLPYSRGQAMAEFAIHYLDATIQGDTTDRDHGFTLLNGAFANCLALLAAQECIIECL